MQKTIARLLAKTARRVARGYIAGPDVADAIRLCQQINRRGWSGTICPWDGPHDSPERVLASYHEAAEAIARDSLDCYLSVKVPSLRYDVGKLQTLLDVASAHHVRVHFDALEPDTATPSLALFKRALRAHDQMGYTLPARWRRSLSDAEQLIEWGVTIRVVKGQWPDPAEPDRHPATGFMELIDLLAGRAAHVTVATHDAALATRALLKLRQAGTPCGLEQLYGLPLCADQVARPLNVPVGLYVPYGYAYLPYALSEAKKHPAIFIRVIKDLLSARSRVSLSMIDLQARPR